MASTLTYANMLAEFGEDNRLRYSLERWLNETGERTALFVGLNPSTADSFKDDPTIRREVGYTRDWGLDRYLKANVYALRSTDPKLLYRVPVSFDPVGPRNKEIIQQLMARAELIVACWGNNKLSARAIEIAEMILADPRTRCLGVTGLGAPKHPLYLKKTTPLQLVAPAKGYVAL